MNRFNKNNNIIKLLFKILLTLLCVNYFLSCSLSLSDLYEDGDDEADESDIYYSELSSTSDWSDETHSKLDTDEIIANIDIVFDTSTVQKMRIVIESENWELMNENLDDLSDELGNSTDFTSIDNPFFVPCELFYSPDGESENELEWYKVGIRFKGNSSLYNANCSKLPFKLDFDEFEDTYEEIDNQRFYGFKQLNLKSNYEDESEMREVVTSQLFSDFGLVSAHCSFYELYINVDGGDEEDDIYYGLYTLVEEVDDTVISIQYGDDNDSGNLYKPEDDAATFASNTYDEDEFNLQTDEDESYEDIYELYTAINDVDSDDWKTNLEAIFDVDIFLKWLAANTVLQNWDTYGVMSHNYFLYNNPSTNKFEWIPWDNNEALDSNNRCLDLDMEEVDNNWPLIRYILDDSSYTETYKSYVSSFASTIFNESYLNPIYEYYEDLIEESVTSEESDYTFTSSREFKNAVNDLEDHTTDRNDAATTYAASE
ncbi:MAG: CotH kinase family protein [Pleomorphochaeta sp.]